MSRRIVPHFLASFRLLWSGLALSAIALGVGLFAQNARAEHFDIGLMVRTSQGQAEASWDTAPPEGGLNRRESVAAKVGEEILLEWRMRSEFPHGTMKDVQVRLFVAQEREIGQAALPPADAPHVLDNSFTADYLPHHTGRGHVRFRVMEPGNYLVRLESETTIAEHGHEHFGAVDLKVE
jgi:hypothetical protein